MRLIAKLTKVFIFLILSFIIFNFGLYAYAYITPKLDLKTANQLYIYDSDGDLAFENLDNSKWIEFSDISENVINATISLEDKNFYNHKGFDYLRIIKAMLTNINKQKIVQGASTISQQYVKNLFLDFDKTWKRKIKEAYLTFELESHYTKEEILEGYLNTINYGTGNYGIESASNYYFNKSASDLTIAEATILVGIPKSPSFYNPITNYSNAKKIQKTILFSMVKNGYLTTEQMNNIYNEKLEFYGKKDNGVLSSLYYYKDAVVKKLNEINTIPDSLIETGGLKIYTTLDVETQEKLESVINEELTIDKLEISSLVVEPNTGKVLALIGGSDYNETQYNRVTQSKRQVGSTIKPFIYYGALSNGFTSSSSFSSELTTFNIGDNKTYSPKNYNNIYANKNISLAAAIAYSDNIYAVKTHLFLGNETLINTALISGIKTDIQNNASSALGTTEINMLDYSNGYSTLANNGIKNESYLIEKVTDINGNIIYEHEETAEKVLNSKYVYILNELLSNTYSYSFVDYSTPTMLSVKNNLSKKYAVKSGTTTTDCWTIGYNPEILVMVWVGYDNNTEVSSKESKISKKIWAKSIDLILEQKKETWYEIPNNVTATLVNPISGVYEKSNKNVLLYYIKGTEPHISNTYELLN